MKRLLIAALLAAGPAIASDLVIKAKDGSQLRLLDSTCSHGATLAAIADQHRPKFKNARILDAKGSIVNYGCWIVHDEDTVVLVFEDGSVTGIPLKAFTDPNV